MAQILVALMWVVLATFPSPVQSREVVAKVEDKAPPAGVSRFLVGTRLGYITCSGKYRAFLEKWELYSLVNEGQANPRMSQPTSEDSSACVHETLLKGRSLYADAAKHAASPAARTALKEYITAWEASLNSLHAKQPEKLRDFDVRQKKQEARLDELQGRLEATAH